MGSELASWNEWNHETSLDWHLLGEPRHRAIELLVGELNRLYRGERALHELDADPAGFRWLDADDAERSLLLFDRRSTDDHHVVCHLAPPVSRSSGGRTAVDAPDAMRRRFVS